MILDEEQKKGIRIVSIKAGTMSAAYRAAMLGLVAQQGVLGVDYEELDVSQLSGDPVGIPSIAEEWPEPEQSGPCDTYFDTNNGRAISHTPPFYTQTKRDVFKLPKGKRGR